jgi:diguanylate cyclase
MEGTPTAHVAIDVVGDLVQFDEGARAVFGHHPDDVLGSPMAELIIPEPLRAAHHDGMARFIRTREPFLIGRTIEITALHADGSVFPVELTLAMQSEDPVVFHATIRRLPPAD